MKMSASLLIEAVKKHRILWDFKCEEYKDNNKKNQAWKTVSNECGMALECAKTKWRGIRDTYIKFSKNKYRPELARSKRKAYMYAESLEFMKPLLQATNNSQPVIKRPRRLKQQTPQEIYKIDYPITTISNNKNNSYPKKKNAISSTNTNASYINSFTNDTTIQQVQHMSATDMLFLSYSKALNSFTRKRQIIIKRRIAEVFADEELEELRDEEEAEQTEDATYDCSAYASTVMEMEVAEHMNPFVRLHVDPDIDDFKTEPSEI